MEKEVAAAEQAKLQNRLQVVSDRILLADSDLCQAIASGKEAVRTLSDSQSAAASDAPGSPQQRSSSSCAYSVMIVIDDQVNANTDGKKVVITSGMMRFVETNDELALVVSHEMAHNALQHVQKKAGNATIGYVAGAVVGALIAGATGVNVVQSLARAGGKIGSGAHSQAFEAEADYVGTYFAARAGFDVSNAANVWRRLAALHPESISAWGSDHPSTPERFVAIEETSKEILAKKAAHQPLVPEMRD